MKYLITLTILVYSGLCLSAENEYKICTAGGYYTGAEDKLLSGLAMHIAVKRGIFGDARCSADWSSAYEAGKNFYSTGKFRNESDREIAKLASKFSSQVYENLSNNIKF